MNYRQGDVFLLKIGASRPLKPKNDKVLVWGEATGHHHVVIDGQVLVDENGLLFVKATKKTKLRHQDLQGNVAEHAELDLQPGLYQVSVEKEYEPEGWRQVYD